MEELESILSVKGIQEEAFVTKMVTSFNEEGYDSMDLDTSRNRFFILAISVIRNSGLTQFLEVGPGASAKLTNYILSNECRDVMCEYQESSYVVAIEVNADSAERARISLHKHNPKRYKLVCGDAVDICNQDCFKEAFECLVAEVIGFVASCEGQCRILHAAAPCLKPHVRFAPRRFATYLTPYTGDLPEAIGTDDAVRIRHLSFTRLMKNKFVAKDSAALRIEEWDSTAMGEATSRTFESRMQFPAGVTALVGHIRLDQGSETSEWCSSAPWCTAKHRAKNWDNLIIQLSAEFSGREVHLRSTVSAFTGNPTYKLKFSCAQTGRLFEKELVFSTTDLVHMRRLG